MITVAVAALFIGLFIGVIFRSEYTEKWLGFYGAIIGAAATIAAGGFAWYAIQRQIVQATEAFNLSRREAAVLRLQAHRIALTDLWNKWMRFQNLKTAERHGALNAAIQDGPTVQAMNEPLMGGDRKAIIVLRSLLNTGAGRLMGGGAVLDHRAEHLVWPLYDQILSSVDLRIRLLRNGQSIAEVEEFAHIDVNKFTRLSVSGEGDEISQLIDPARKEGG